MKSYAKRLLACILAISMVFSSVPVAFASTGAYANGVAVASSPNGTATNPDGATYPNGSTSPNGKLSIANISFCEEEEVVEGTCGYMRSSYDENGNLVKWYYYDLYEVTPPYMVTMSDGEDIQVDGDSFYYKGHWYCPDIFSDQSYDNQWGVGVHEVTMEIAGHTAKGTVRIIESPVLSITFDNEVDIIEGTRGYYDSDYDENDNRVEWYRYNLWSTVPSYTITMKDGTIIQSDDEYYEYQGEEYELQLDSDQSYDTPWKIGKNQVQVNCMGYRTSFAVNIVESPVTSVSFDEVKIVAETNGAWDYYYNDEDEKNYYYHYDLWELVPSYTIKMKDGTIITSDDNYFEYNGEEYPLDYDDPQTHRNPWSVGKHEVKVNVLGHESSFYINITESQIQNIEFDPVYLEAYTNGCYLDSNYDEEYEEYGLEPSIWFHYRVDVDELTYKVIMENGETISGKGNSFNHDGVTYKLIFSDDQSADNEWRVGNQEMTVTVAGYDGKVPVVIKESQVESIRFLNIEELIEHENGYFSGNTFRYNTPEYSYEVTKKDGTKVIHFSDIDGSFDDEETGEQLFYFDKGSEPWSVGSNKVTLYFGGCIAEGYVTIKSDSDIQYVEQNGAAYITGYKGHEKSLSIPSEIDGLQVKGILSFDSDIVRSLTVPDSIETIAPFESNYALQNVKLGENVNNLSADTFRNCYNLQNIDVVYTNPYYTSDCGIVYDKEMTTLIAFPPGRTEGVCIPATVTNIDVIKDFLNGDFNITFEDGSTGFVTIDGVTYSADMKKVIYCNTEKEGSVVIPDTVETILDGAFRGCSKLTDVTVSNKVTAIVYETFANCKNLTNVTMPDSITAIDEYAFYNCGSLQSVDLPAELVEIGTSAFASSNLTALDLPQKVTRINGMAFYSNQIGSLSIPNSVTYLGDSVFTGNQIESIDIPDSVTYLGAYAFSANDELTTANIGKGVSQLRNNTFSSCDNLTTVNLENSQVVIGESVFANTSLKDINFDHIAGYGRYAFAKTKLEKLPAMDSVASITYGAFYDCADLSDITLSGNVKDVSGHSFDGTKWYETQNKGVTYLNHVLYDYKGDAAVSSEVTVKDGTKVIADAAFEETIGLENVFLPDTLEHIGEAAFYGCTDLEEIIIPTNVTEIESRAFSGCKKLMKLSVATDNAFYKSDKNVLYNKAGTELIWCGPQENKTFEVPVTVKVIKNNSFADSSVTDIVISNRETEFELTYRSAPPQWKNFIFHCYEDSKVYNFAMENGLNVVLLKECEHSWATEYTVDKAATCTETGSKSIRCTLCNEQDESTITTIPATHTWNKDYTVDKAATCTTAGSKSIHCNECSATKDVTAIDKLAHKEAIVAGKAATCTATGLTAGKQCTVCKTVTVKQTTIAKLAHNYKTTLTKATTSKDGKIVKKCSCGYVESTTTIKKASKISLSKSAYTYTGKVIKAPTITVKDSAGKTIAESNYTIFKPSKTLSAVGEYTYTIKFKGNYSGTKKLTLTIKPVKPTIQTPKAAKKAITVKWKKGSKSQVTGYEVMVATNSKFSKNKKTATVKGYSKTSYKMTKLKAKTKYYVKVRSYKTVKGVKIYSDWSKVKTIKTK